MSTKAKRTVSIILTLLLVLSFTACSVPTDQPGEQVGGSTQDQPNDTQAPVEKKGRIGVVYTMTGRGDMAFNDLTYKGAMRAGKEFGLQIDHVEPKTLSEMEMAFEDMASSGDYDLIVGISFQVVDAMSRIAPDYPEQKFALVDTAIELDNVVSYIARENEAAFLVGAFAGLLNQYKPENGMVGDNNVIGLVGAVDSDVINRHIAGFTCGAKYVNPDITVLHDYVGNFSDTATAQTIAETMHNMGADIVYNVSAAAGLGIFKAAVDNNFLVIGLDNNQCPIEPDHIVASMLKRVDEFVYSAISDAIHGDFKGGQAFYLGLAENGVGYTTEGSNVVIDPQIVEIVDKIRNMVVSGELTVPTTKGEIDAWVAANHYEGN